MAVRNVEAELVSLTPLREAPLAEAVPALRKAIGSRLNVVAAKAAKIAAERQIRELIPDLLRAFERFFEKPAERDPQCWGKNAIAKALVEMEHRESATFLRGIKHIQMEPVWGGEEDTASTVRGTCVLALVACSDIAPERTLRCLVDALADKAPPVRIEAVRGLAQMDGALLLRLKAHVGDEELNVVGQVFDSILALEREEGLEFVAQFLNSKNDAVGEEAALAMGSSRLPAAVGLLRRAWEETKEVVLLRAISASRQDEAIAFLLEMVVDGRLRDAQAALEALELHKESEEIWKQVEAAKKERDGLTP
jgi:HEAT repeat protein